MHLIRLSLLLLLLAATSSTASVQNPPQPPPPMSLSGCASSLAALYPCFTFIASPPDRSEPSHTCCATFFQALSTAGPTCACHLVHEPVLLGYTIDTSRLVDLFPMCGVHNTAFAMLWFQQACQQGNIAPAPANVANPN